MFGWSWTEASVLDSEVFGQASMEGCEGGREVTGKSLDNSFEYRDLLLVFQDQFQVNMYCVRILVTLK